MTTDDLQQPLETQNATVEDALETGVSEHDTLKYHLLGPSLTKAGQDSVDQQKVISAIEPDLPLCIGLR